VAYWDLVTWPGAH